MQPETEIIKSSWQLIQKGLTLRIKPYPPEFEEEENNEIDPKDLRNWYLNYVKTGNIIHYSIIQDQINLLGFIYISDILNKTCMINVEILDHTNYRKGIGSEALSQFLSLIKKDFQLENVKAKVYKNNFRAISFCKSNGFASDPEKGNSNLDRHSKFFIFEKQI